MRVWVPPPHEALQVVNSDKLQLIGTSQMKAQGRRHGAINPWASRTARILKPERAHRAIAAGASLLRARHLAACSPGSYCLLTYGVDLCAIVAARSPAPHAVDLTSHDANVNSVFSRSRQEAA